MRIRLHMLAAAAIVVAGLAVPAVEAQPGGVDRLYVMDCGHNAATDQSRWSPGVNVGKPLELSDNCYLIRHGTQWLLWDTGYPDAVADKPLTSPIGTATRAQDAGRPARRDQAQARRTSPWSRSRTPMATTSAMSTCSRKRPLLIQKAELDWAFADGKPAPFKKDRPIKRAERRFRRIRRRQRHHPVDAGPYAGAPVAARAPAEDRLGRADRRPRALQGQLGQRPRAVDEHQRRPDARFACQAHARCWPTRRPSSGSTTTSRPALGQKHSPEFYQ